MGTTKFSRVDIVTCAYLQWIVRCNEYGGNIVIPNGLLLYLNRARKKYNSFQQAIGQYGEDAFLLTMIICTNNDTKEKSLCWSCNNTWFVDGDDCWI
ncbi:MAG: hypothetical protein ACI90V_002811 [Bacillariaceae sp.]